MEHPGIQLKDHFQQFRRIVSRAELAFRRGNLHSAIAWSQVAAHFAWERHPGLYYDLTLESLLTQIASQVNEKSVKLNTQMIIPAKSDSKKKHILHVITGCKGLGGHTLVITGWINNTFENAVHSIVATTQLEPLPLELTAFPRKSRGWSMQIARYSSNLVERSLLLRRFQSWADLIVIHVNPSDALPNVAFGIEGGSPVIFLNHADDVFWLGTSISDIVLDLHPSGQSQTLTRRGVKNSKILPIPLNPPPQAFSYETARQKLGIKPSTTLLLTVARECKYLPIGTHDFLTITASVVKKHSDVLLVAVGPENHGRWADVSSISNGRIRPMGGIIWSDLHAFYAAADIFLDSFPIGTGTAFLEAGMRGIPTIGLQFKEAPSLTECTDDVAFGDSNPFPASIEDYELQLKKMIAERYSFREKAKEYRDLIVAHHCSPGWNRYLFEIMDNLPSKHSIWVPSKADAIIEPVNNIVAEWDAEVLGKETSQETFARLIVSYSKQLEKADMLQEQTTTFIKEFTKKPSVKKIKPFLYSCRKSLSN